MNYLVQGTSAYILNESMILVYEYLKCKKSNILLQVHDEIICEIHNDEIRNIPQQIQQLLETNSLEIPLKVDIALCKPSWATKIEWEEPEVMVDQLEDYIDWEDAYAYA